jgi:hypothetical protein
MMKSVFGIFLIILLTCLTLSFSGCGEDDSSTRPAAKDLIVPGSSAAGIRLEDPFEDVKALYGETTLNKDYFSYRAQGVSGFVDDNNLVTNIFINAPNKAKTAGGIGIGSSYHQVTEAFGYTEKDETTSAYRYLKKGIGFTFDGNSKVTMIHIFKLNTFLLFLLE